jgi:hypothetical protein
LKAIQKAGDDQKKKRKLVRKKAPEGFVSWGEPSFKRLIAAEPETLSSSMQITSAMLINVIGRGGDVYRHVHELIFDNHEPWKRQLALARRALGIYRTLRAAGIVEQVGGDIRLMVDLQPNFALNQPLSTFALAAFELLDPEASANVEEQNDSVGTGNYALDLISVLESTLDDPRPVLSAQQFVARGEAVAAMKAEGIEYDQRMDLLEAVTHPKPLDELLSQAFETYASSQPWVRDFELSPKSVVRDMYERAMSFGEYVAFYKLTRSEGVVLRYLSDAYRAARQTIPDELKNEELLDVIEWLGELVRQVDSSLLDEWEELVHPDAARHESETALVPPAPRNVTTNRRAFTVLVRNEMFRRVQLAAREAYDELATLSDDLSSAEWADSLDAYFAEHDEIRTDADARSPAMLIVDESAATDGLWRVRQILADPAGDHDWGIAATVDLAESAELGAAAVHVTAVDRL